MVDTCLLLCFRARGLKCEDVSLTRDRERDTDIPMWKHERLSRTRQGQGIPYSVRSFHPTAKATGNKRCPVKIYKEFAEKMQGSSEEFPTTRGEKRTFHVFLMPKLQRILVTED